MPIIQLIIILALIGFILWAVVTYVPMEPIFKRLLVGVVCLLVILWMLQIFGVLGSLHTVRVG